MKGFTLIELLCVIVILGGLSAVAVPRFAYMVDAADEAVVSQTLSAMRASYRNLMAQYRLAGSPGSNLSTSTYLTVNGVSVSFKDGYPEDTMDSSHVPTSVTNKRNASQTRLFFVLLADETANNVIDSTEDGPGWEMLGTNNSCTPGINHRRCWQYKRGGSQVARITYFTRTGEFVLD